MKYKIAKIWTWFKSSQLSHMDHINVQCAIKSALEIVQIVTSWERVVHKRGALFVALLRPYTYDRAWKTRCSPRPFSLPVPRTDTTIGHASRSLCNATPYAFIRAYPHDKHRAAIDICPYRSKGFGDNKAVQQCRGRRDRRNNVALTRSQLRLSLSRIYGTRDVYHPLVHAKIVIDEYLWGPWE